MALTKRQKDYYKKWKKIETYLTTSDNIDLKILNHLEKAYKTTTTEQEREIIINDVYNHLFMN